MEVEVTTSENERGRAIGEEFNETEEQTLATNKALEDRGPELQGDELDVHHEEIVEAGPLLQELLAKQLPPVLRVKPLRLTKTPVTAYTGDAGFDLEYAPADFHTAIVRPGHVTFLETGIAVAIPEGYAGLVLPRSGMAAKRGLRPINTPGLIDSGYRGEIVVAMEAVLERMMVTPGERIAQLVIVPVLTPIVEIVDELDDTERGDGGFGSSGS